MRIASDYTAGRTGIVLEVKDGRARIQWDAGTPRTWVRFSDLREIAPDIERGEWIQTPGSTRHTALRVCRRPATGETWHEYQKR